VASWPLGEPLALRERMQTVTLEVILRAVFGVRDERRLALYREAIPRLADTSNLLIWTPFIRFDFGRLSPVARFRRAKHDVDELIYAEIAERRADPGGDDVLSLLLAARHEDGSPMSDSELRDELMTLLTAGHETTATGLAWAFERLLRTPAAYERLMEDPDDDAYLDAVVTETLRVRPVITDVARKLVEDTEVRGYRLPAGTLVLAAIAALHLRPELYPEPHAFKPERFLGDSPGTYSWIPFGGGIRRCIGAAFAQMEMKVALSTIAARVRLRAEDPAPERPRIRNVTTVPARGTRVVVAERLDGERTRPGARLASTA
jgi:cytochrome P450